MPGLFAIDHVAWNVNSASKAPCMSPRYFMKGRVLRDSYSEDVRNSAQIRE
jgi:hypothetical protein